MGEYRFLPVEGFTGELRRVTGAHPHQVVEGQDQRIAHGCRQVLWFSVLVSKASNLPAIQTALKKAGARESQVVEMSQGNKQSRFVAWTFHDKDQQQVWREKNWK